MEMVQVVKVEQVVRVEQVMGVANLPQAPLSREGHAHHLTPTTHVTARTLHRPTLVLAVAVVTPRLILHTATNLHSEAAAATSTSESRASSLKSPTKAR